MISHDEGVVAPNRPDGSHQVIRLERVGIRGTPISLHWSVLAGYTHYGPVNAILGVFGAVSVAIACLNLLPFRPSDGAVAWTIAPILFRALRARPESDRRDRPRRHEKPLRRVH
jgi:hypothetical protein